MGFKFKVPVHGSKEPVSIAGIGTVVPGKQAHISDAQAADFEANHGWPITDVEEWDVTAAADPKPPKDESELSEAAEAAENPVEVEAEAESTPQEEGEK